MTHTHKMWIEFFKFLGWSFRRAHILAACGARSEPTLSRKSSSAASSREAFTLVLSQTSLIHIFLKRYVRNRKIVVWLIRFLGDSLNQVWGMLGQRLSNMHNLFLAAAPRHVISRRFLVLTVCLRRKIGTLGIYDDISSWESLLFLHQYTHRVLFFFASF